MLLAQNNRDNAIYTQPIFIVVTPDTIPVVTAKSVADDTRSPIFFIKTLHDFGPVLKKSEPETEFSFTNLSNEPLIIQRVEHDSSLTAEYPKTPIAVNTFGMLKIRISTEGVTGDFNKTVKIFFNQKDKTTGLPMEQILTLSGSVK